MARICTASMRYVGMKREDIKEVVLQKVAIGQQYYFKSDKDHTEDKRYNNYVKGKLISLSRNVAVFEHSDGTRESLTYQDIWRKLLEGDFK